MSISLRIDINATYLDQLIYLSERLGRIVQPRLRQRTLLFKLGDFLHFLHGKTDIVQSIKQAVLSKRIHLKADNLQ